MQHRRWIARRSVRELDQRAVDEFGLAGIVLMENAGRGVCDVLTQGGSIGPVVVCAGKGNNGGDGLVVARHLDNRGLPVHVLLCCDPATMSSDARINYQILQAACVPMSVVSREGLDADQRTVVNQAQWLVDAILGTGTQGEIRQPLVAVIEAINSAPGRVLSIDVPSGMDCDSGRPLNACVRADRTATLVAAKLGFRDADSVNWTGEVHIVDIGIPRKLLETHDWEQV